MTIFYMTDVPPNNAVVKRRPLKFMGRLIYDPFLPKVLTVSVQLVHFFAELEQLEQVLFRGPCNLSFHM
jgi:hypothetical protein